MAQVKVQTSAPLAGPGLSPGVPPAAMASPGPLGLQPSVNGTGPAPTPACPAPAVGYGDDPVSATSPGRRPRESGGAAECLVLLFLFTVNSINYWQQNNEEKFKSAKTEKTQTQQLVVLLISLEFKFAPPRLYSTNKQPLASLSVGVFLLTLHGGLFVCNCNCCEILINVGSSENPNVPAFCLSFDRPKHVSVLSHTEHTLTNLCVYSLKSSNVQSEKT